MGKLRPCFSSAVSRELGVSLAEFNVAHARVARAPSLGGRAKAIGQPVANQRSLEDIIRSSDMGQDEIGVDPL